MDIGYCACAAVFSHVRLFAIPCVACQAPLFTEFFRQEYCKGLPFPPPGDLPDPGIKSVSISFPAFTGGFFTTSATWEAQIQSYYNMLPIFPVLYFTSL